MNPERAIKILVQHQRDHEPLSWPDFYEAEQLGIEALARIFYRRRWPSTSWHEPLPSETEE